MGPDQIFQDDDEQKRRLIPSLPPPAVAGPSMGPSLSVPKIGPAQSELQRLESTGSGVSQIHNPILRGLARFGDAIGTFTAPKIMAAIPGTTVHHDQLVNRQAGLANQEASYTGRQAQTGLQTAEAGHLNAETDALQHPVDKPASNEVELFQQDPSQLEAFYKAKGGNPEKMPANPQAGYASAIADALKNGRDPNTDPHVQAWRSAIESTQKEPTVNRDDKAIALRQKQSLGQALTPEESAYLKSYDQYVKQTKVDPGVQRMQVLLNGRLVPTVEEGGKAVYTPVTQAAGKESPQSIPFQTEKSVTRAFTSGPESKTLSAFNTAHEHLQQFAQAADALGNGNLQLVNRIANSYAAATGNPAPTNFDSIRAAVAGEISKTFKGTGAATDDEIRQINDTINRTQSPQQLKGAIQTYTRLMESKRHALQQQYQSGMQGQPNFGADVNQGGGGGIIYARDPKGQLHKAPAGTQLPQGWKQEAQQ